MLKPVDKTLPSRPCPSQNLSGVVGLRPDPKHWRTVFSRPKDQQGPVLHTQGTWASSVNVTAGKRGFLLNGLQLRFGHDEGC